MAPVDAAAPGRVRRALGTTRTRLLVWYLVLLSVAALVQVVALRQGLLARQEARVEEDLRQEVEEFRALVADEVPAAGGPDVAPLVEAFLSRNLPASREAFFTYLDGRPFLGSTAPRADLFERDDLTRRWGTLTTTDRGQVATAAGAADYLAVPVLREDGAAATFVVVAFTDLLRQDVDDAVRLAIVVDGVVLALATGAAFLASGQVLQPLRRITETARRIQDDDLSRRLEVTGNDELAELGRTFNAMLDRLQSSLESQRQFAADAGHELRTPLTIVRGHLELMGDDPQDRRETVALVTDELDRMARLVDDLLLLARAQRPDFLALAPLDGEALVRHAAQKAAALGERDWQLDAVATGVAVHGDEHRLTQALLQLAANAVRHTAPGDVVALGSSYDGAQLRVWVRDTGEGIAAQDRERIFERFARGRPSRDEGSGLGLAIVRAIAEGHGGRVEVASELGVGSTFTLVLPVGREVG